MKSAAQRGGTGTATQQQEQQQAKLTKQLEYAQLQRRLHVLLDEIIPRGATVLMASRGDDALLHLCTARDVSHFPRTSDGTWTATQRAARSR
jgi:hypothetical protein